MYSTPSAFSDYQNQLDGPAHMIVELTDGSTTWYLSDTAMVLTDGAVHDLLISVSGISEKIDLPFSRKWAVGSVSLTLSNRPYQRVDGEGTFERLADQLTDVQFNTAKIYLMAGARATALSGCMTRFVGTVVDPIEYNADTLRVRIADNGLANDVLLPETLIGETYGMAPQESRELKIPLVFGEFIGEDDTNAPVGLAVAVKINNSSEPRYVVSDHVLDTFVTNYTKLDQFPDVTDLSEDTSCYPNYSGRGIIQLSSNLYGHFEGTTKIRPKDDFPGDYNVRGYPIEFAKAIDRDPTTYAELRDNIDTGSTSADYMGGSLLACMDNYASGGRYDNDIGEPIGDYAVQVLAEFVVQGAPYWNGAAIWWYYGKSGGTDDALKIADFTTATAKTLHSHAASITNDPPNLRADWTWHMRSGDVDTPAGNAWPLCIWIGLETETNLENGSDVDADGTTNNQWLMRIYDIRVASRHRTKTPGPMFAECKGYQYDSNITGRSSNYADGDCIEDPVGIVEWIVRDYMDMADADIDLTSFINAENTSVKARINFHSGNEMTAIKAIQQLAEQSTCAFFFSGSGKLRCIDLSDTSPSTDRTIPWSHITPSSIKVAKNKKIINHLTVNSRWREEFGAYSDTDVVEDSTSQTNYGTHKYAAKWPNIAAGSVDHITDFLVNSTDGLWSKKHNEIELQTKLFTNADLEIGDWIELDSTSVDPHIKCFGVSWSGKQFMVTSLIQTMAGTKIKAIELW